MNYVRITNGLASRYTLRQMRNDNPAVSFPEQPNAETLAAFGVYLLTEAPRPIISDSQVLEPAAQPAAQGDGTYVWGWSIQSKSLEALAQEAREQRNALLAASDWTQVADAPVDQAAWATYRQALRDITVQAGFPTGINWPVAPE